MYSVVFSKNAHIRPVEYFSLKDAIKAKLAIEITRPSGKAVILDEDGYIMSAREQTLYIIQNLA